jgi:tetratricopeptide (TPR) repeat protein
LLIAQVARANAEIILGNIQSAELELRAVVAAHPSEPVAQERLGYAQLRQQRFQDAEHNFEQALSLQADFVPAMYGLLELYQEQNRDENIIPRIQTQIQRAPGQGDFYELLGRAYAARHDLQKAELAFQQAIARNPSAFIAYAALAEIHLGGDNPAQAISDAREAIEKSPEYLPAYLTLGRAYESVSQWEQAKQTYESLLSHDPSDATALNNLSWLYCEHGGNLDQALNLAQKAKQSSPDDPNISDTLGWIKYRKGLYKSAVASLREAVQRAPDVAEFQFHLGMAFVGAGRSAEAEPVLKRALQLGLAPADAERARSRLEAKSSSHGL